MPFRDQLGSSVLLGDLADWVCSDVEVASDWDDDHAVAVAGVVNAFDAFERAAVAERWDGVVDDVESFEGMPLKSVLVAAVVVVAL